MPPSRPSSSSRTDSRSPAARSSSWRGAEAESVLTHLLERRLIRVVGRKAAPGRPLLYGTTREFLEHFGLRDLGELPPFDAPPRPSDDVVVDPEALATPGTPEVSGTGEWDGPGQRGSGRAGSGSR